MLRAFRPVRSSYPHLMHAVKRNLNKLDEDFVFELTADEMSVLSISQNVISIQTRGVKGGRSKL